MFPESIAIFRFCIAQIVSYRSSRIWQRIIALFSRRYRRLFAFVRRHAAVVGDVARPSGAGAAAAFETSATVENAGVSIIVNTYNRADLLERLLTAITLLRHEAIEVVVVNGPSTDHTPSVLWRWADRIKIASAPVRNLSTSRNIGVAVASGEILAFIDDDAVPEPDWIGQHLETMAKTGAVATGGVIRDRDGLAFQSRCLLSDSLANVKPTLDKCADEADSSNWRLTLTGTNFVVWREAVVEAGGYDEYYRYFLEETDLQRRIQASGGKLAFCVDAEVHHSQAQNEVRDSNAVHTSFFVLIRSLIHFCRRHGGASRGSGAVVDRIVQELCKMRRKIRASRRAGAIDQRAARALWRSALRGVRGSATDARSATMPLARTARTAPFKSFWLDGRRWPVDRYAIVDDGAAGDRPRPSEALARELRSQGHEVTLIYPPEGKASVQFEAGCWRHRPRRRRGVISRLFGPGSARAGSAAELRRVSVRRAFNWVVTIVDGVDGVKFFVAPYDRRYGTRAAPMGRGAFAVDIGAASIWQGAAARMRQLATTPN